MKSLVTYFSAEFGATKNLAEQLAASLGADLFEIKPEKPYTKADLKYTNPLARCNREKVGRKEVPVSGSVSGWEDYDTVYIGFPIWYGSAPNVVNTFCKQYDWTGKEIYIFATSGGSGIGKTAEKLEPFVKGGRVADAKKVNGISDLSAWM